MEDQLHINIAMNCPLSNQDSSQIKKKDIHWILRERVLVEMSRRHQVSSYLKIHKTLPHFLAKSFVKKNAVCELYQDY